jgi:group I intron endonuclease
MIVFYNILEVLIVLVPILMTVAFVTIAERKVMASMQRRCGPNAVGIWGILQPFADALKLLVKEIIIPRQSNSLLFVIGPCITLIFALLGWAIIPFGEGLAIFDYELGVFFALAVSSIGSYGILVSGWAANSKYAFMGAIRSTAQLLSYELVFSSIILILIIFSGSFSLTYIVECQQAVWNIFPLLPIALMFFIAILAETNRPPFDLPEAGFGLLNKKKLLVLFNNKFTICWNVLIFYLDWFNNVNFNKISRITFRGLKAAECSSQRLNVNKVKYEYISFMLKSIFYLLNNYYNNKNFINLSTIIKPDVTDLKFIEPKKIYYNIDVHCTQKNIAIELKDYKGIYGFFCVINKKIYIGSSENLVKRFKEHIKGKKSNIYLQNAINEYGLDNFYYIIFEFYNRKDIIMLSDIETKYISYIRPDYLYNFKFLATSMLGYKHDLLAKQKMVAWFKKHKHPMLGKHHTIEVKESIRIQNEGKSNPMYGKKHKDSSKKLISFALSKPVYMYKWINGSYLLYNIYPNSTVVAKLLNLHKTTVGRYIKKEKIIVWKTDKYLLSRVPIIIN